MTEPDNFSHETTKVLIEISNLFHDIGKEI